jgi:hypothetical protein
MIMNKLHAGLGSLLAVSILSLSITTAIADEKTDRRVSKALQNRTSEFCKAVLPAWFGSKAGMRDQNVRALVADCYTGHARLGILGVKSDLSLDDTSLSEVPAALLSKKYGMKLDIYRPLAGRVLHVRQAKK